MFCWECSVGVIFQVDSIPQNKEAARPEEWNNSNDHRHHNFQILIIIECLQATIYQHFCGGGGGGGGGDMHAYLYY